MKNKILISLPIILSALLVVGSLYVLRDVSAPDAKRPIDFNNMKMNVYENPLHHYRINYPSYLTPVVDNAANRQITAFVHDDQFGEISIIVASTTVLSALAWVEEYNRSYTGFPPYTGRFRIKREIIISGIAGVVVYPYSDFQGQIEEFAYEESALIVKDGKLFQISAYRTADPEKIWNSFKFLDISI